VLFAFWRTHLPNEEKNERQKEGFANRIKSEGCLCAVIFPRVGKSRSRRWLYRELENREYHFIIASLIVTFLINSSCIQRVSVKIEHLLRFSACSRNNLASLMTIQIAVIF